MTQYVSFDSAVPAPSPVTGWYDTSVHDYPSLPPAANLLELPDGDETRFAGGSWAVSDGALVAYTPPPPVLSLPMQAIQALGKGLTIISGSSTELNGLYAVDPSTANNIQAEMLAILVTGNFADGAATVPWPDTSGAVHTFSIKEFKAFALAIAAYVATLYKCINGSVTVMPSNTVTIL